MLMGARDEPFAAFVSAYRTRLLGTATPGPSRSGAGRDPHRRRPRAAVRRLAQARRPVRLCDPGGGESRVCRGPLAGSTRSTTSSWWTSTPCPLVPATTSSTNWLRSPKTSVGSSCWPPTRVSPWLASPACSTATFPTSLPNYGPPRTGCRPCPAPTGGGTSPSSWRGRDDASRGPRGGRRTKGRSILAPPPPAQARGGGRRPDRRSRAGDPAGGAAPHSGGVPRPGSRHKPSHHEQADTTVRHERPALPDRDRLWLAVRDGGRDQLLP